MRFRSLTTLFTRRALLLAAGLAVGTAALVDARLAAAQEPLKIGIIGTGRIGGALARHWVNAGHEVFVSSRHPEELEPLVKELGPRAHVGTPREAAAFGSVVLVSVPYGAMPQIGADFAAELAGKVILDTSNPNERPRRRRSARVATQGRGRGDGRALEEQPRRARVQLHSRRVAGGSSEPSTGAYRDSDRRRRRGSDRDRGAVDSRCGLRPRHGRLAGGVARSSISASRSRRATSAPPSCARG